MTDPPRTPQQQIPTRYRYRVVTSPRRTNQRGEGRLNLLPRPLIGANGGNRVVNRPNQRMIQRPNQRLISGVGNQRQANDIPHVHGRTQVILDERTPPRRNVGQRNLLQRRVTRQQPQQQPQRGLIHRPRQPVHRRVSTQPFIGNNSNRSTLRRHDGFRGPVMRMQDRSVNQQPRPTLVQRRNQGSPQRPSQNPGMSLRQRRLLQSRNQQASGYRPLLQRPNNTKKLKPLLKRPGASVRSQKSNLQIQAGRLMMLERMRKSIVQKNTLHHRRRNLLLKNPSKSSLLSYSSDRSGLDSYDRLLLRSQLFDEHGRDISHLHPRVLDNTWSIQLSDELTEEEDAFSESELVYTRKRDHYNLPVVRLPLEKMKPLNPFFDEHWGDDEYCHDEDSVGVSEPDMKRGGVAARGAADEDDDDDDINNSPEVNHIHNFSGPLSDDFQTGGFLKDEDDVDDTVSEYVVGSEARGNELNVRYFTIMDIQRKESTHFLVRTYHKIRTLFQKISVCCCGRCGCGTNCNPCGLILRNVERNFGSGIASFYDLWVSIIWMNIAIFATCFFLLVVPWLMRTDIAFTEKLSRFIHYKFFLGLLGVSSDVIGETFFFYSGYAPWINETTVTVSTTSLLAGGGNTSVRTASVTSLEIPPFHTRLLYTVPYEFRFAYPVTIVSLLFLCFVIILVSIGKRIRIVNKMDRELKYSTGILSLWDHSLVKKGGILAQKRFITSTFLEYLQMERQEEKGLNQRRSVRKICCLLHRRLVGWALTTIILIGSPIGVFFVSAFNSTLNSSFPFTSTMIIFAMNSILPTFLNAMVSLENYRSEKVATYNRIVRTFVIKTSLLISLVVRVLFISGEDGECVPTEAGVMFWQLVLVDVIQTVFVQIFLNFGKLVINRNKRKTEFNIPKNVNLLFYRQSIIWVGTLVSPMLPLLGIFSSVVLFLTSYMVMSCTMRFPTKPITNAKGNIFNQTLLFLTLFIALIPTIVFFVQPGGYGCGPAHNEALVYGFRVWKYFPVKGVVGVIDTVMEYSPYFLTIFLVISFSVAYLIYQRYLMYYEKFKTSEERVRIERILIGQGEDDEKKRFLNRFKLEFVDKEKSD